LPTVTRRSIALLLSSALAAIFLAKATPALAKDLSFAGAAFRFNATV